MKVDSEYVEMIGRNLGYFETLLEDNERRSFDVLDDNQDGFYKSIRIAATIPSMSARAARLFINGYTFIEQRGNYKRWARAAVRIANRFESDDPYLRCRVVSLLGLLQYESGDWDRARTSFIASERLAFDCEDDAAVANAWYYRAVLDYHDHLPAQSIDWLHKAQTIISSYPAPLPFDLNRLSGFIFNLLGVISSNQSLFSDAMGYFEQAKSIFESLSLTQFVVIVNMNVSDIYGRQGKINSAITLLNDVVHTCRHDGLFVAEVKALLGLVGAYGELKQWDKSLEIIDRIDQIKLMRMGYLGLLAQTKSEMGVCLAGSNQFDEAAVQVKEAISILQPMDSGIALATATGTLANIYLSSSQAKLAKETFANAIDLARACGSDSRVIELISELEAGLEKTKVPV